MNKKIRELQLKVLNEFLKVTKTFALAGGTALELFYLNHRFSKDLDFLSVSYSGGEINSIMSALKQNLNLKIELESEFNADSKANVRFYKVSEKKSADELKIDFIEEVLFDKPKIEYHNKIPVYSVENIYFQKINAIAGTKTLINPAGGDIITGRSEIRDIIDLYFLSKKVKPLNIYISSLTREYQRKIIRWYQTYSRQDFILDFLDYEIYDKSVSGRQIIKYIDDELKKVLQKEIE